MAREVRMLAWYLRRAVPWAALLGCLAVAVAMVLPAREWEFSRGLAVVFAVVVPCAAAGLCFDEPAREVASVTPRAARWAMIARVMAAAVPFAIAVGAVVVIGDPTPVADWTLVAASVTGVVSFVALVAAGAGSARPGAQIASVVVLLAVVPQFLEQFLSTGVPYPEPTLSDFQTGAWTLVLGLSLSGVAAVILRPLATAARR